MFNQRHTAVIIATISLLSACSGSGSSGNSDPTTQPIAKGVSNPTYTDHVAAILNDNCVTCHRSGGIAPFTLDNYANASTYAAAIKADINSRIMPPFLADNSGACNTFSHARWLSDADIETLNNWVDQGEAPGDPAAPLPPPVQSGLTPAEISTTISMSEVYTPKASTVENPNDDYHCFVLDPGITGADKFLTAYQVAPGNAALVHHIVLFAINSQAAEDAAVALDQKEAGPGYTCFGDSGVDLSLAADVPVVAGWAPGIKETRFPAGTGVRLKAGRKMIMQVHYNLENAPGTDLTSMDLALQDSVSSEATMGIVADTTMTIPAGQADAAFTASFTVPTNYPTLKVHGLFPHMHTLGRSMTIERQPANGGPAQCLANLPRWSFEWQQYYFYDGAPLSVNPGDKINVTCHYDTRSRTQPVTWGNGTQDEMCLSFFYITL